MRRFFGTKAFRISTPLISGTCSTASPLADEQSRLRRMRRRWLVLMPLLVSTLACQAVTGLWRVQPSATLTPSVTFTASPTPTSSPSPVPSPSSTPSAAPSPTVTETPVPGDTGLQLQVFESLWGTVNEKYLYSDFNGVDWQAIHTEYRQRIEAGLSEAAFYSAMRELVASLGDEHSVYFSPREAEELDAEYTGNYDYVGIGIFTITIPERRRIAIITIFPDSPAEKAGLKVHDSILAVEGQAIVDKAGFHRELLLGPVGSFIELTVQSPGDQPRLIRLQRARINGAIPVFWQVLISPNGKRIGYIQLVTFNDSTVDDQVEQALVGMGEEAALDGLILDNRLNSGGSGDVLSDVLANFTEGIVGHFVSRQAKHPVSVASRDLSGSQSLALVVLVGRGTASFGEIFAGILKDLGRAILIGETTNGNVEILRVYNFPDGSRAWIAHETFQPINHPDQDWEQTGIVPDIMATSNWDEVTLEDDPVIQAALESFDKE